MNITFCFVVSEKDVRTDDVVMSYVKVLEQFSEDRKGFSRVNIVEHDPLKIDHFTKGILSMITRSQARKNKIEDTSVSNLGILQKLDFLGKEGIVKIFSVLQNIETVEVAAVVSTEDKTISGKSKIARTLFKLGNESYKQDHAKLSEGAHHAEVGSVFETKVSGGQLKCHYVFHTIVPRRNRDYCRDTSSLEKDVRYTVKRILEKATELRCDSLALPFIGTSGRETYLLFIHVLCNNKFLKN